MPVVEHDFQDLRLFPESYVGTLEDSLPFGLHHVVVLRDLRLSCPQSLSLPLCPSPRLPGNPSGRLPEGLFELLEALGILGKY